MYVAANYIVKPVADANICTGLLKIVDELNGRFYTVFYFLRKRNFTGYLSASEIPNIYRQQNYNR